MRMAGLFDIWYAARDQPMYSFTILTTDSCEKLQWCAPPAKSWPAVQAKVCAMLSLYQISLCQITPISSLQAP